jgi:hypothetical protein
MATGCWWIPRVLGRLSIDSPQPARELYHLVWVEAELGETFGLESIE